MNQRNRKHEDKPKQISFEIFIIGYTKYLQVQFSYSSIWRSFSKLFIFVRYIADEACVFYCIFFLFSF